MGGTISFTLREVDGTEHRMSRWTNMTPHAVVNLALLEKRKSHIQGILEPWYEMCEDYRRNSSSRQFKLPMTDVYVPAVGLAPDGYGLLVVDLHRELILSMQGYTNYTRIFGLYDDSGRSFWRDEEMQTLLQAPLPEEISYGEGSAKTAIRLYRAGRLTFVPYSDESATPSKVWPKSIHFEHISVDMQPFRVVSFPETAQGARDFRGTLIELGFSLSAKEEAQWAEWIKEKVDEEEEYEEEEEPEGELPTPAPDR